MDEKMGINHYSKQTNKLNSCFLYDNITVIDKRKLNLLIRRRDDDVKN